MNTMHTSLAALLLAAAAMQTAQAADDDLPKRVAACTHEQDDTRRLACFDRAAAPQAHQANAEKVDPTQAFGLPGSELARNTADDSDAKEDSAPKRITAKVAGVDKRARGELVVTLDNGQVWAQKEVGAYFPIKVGDAATILAGTLGSYRLVVANRATPVTRVR